MRLIYNYKNKTCVVLFIVFGLLKGNTQNKQILYNWDATQQSLMLNPGDVVRYEAHLGIPFLSQIHASGGSSGVSAFDIFKDDGVPINAKIDEIISELSSRDFFTTTEQLEIFNMGWRNKYGTYVSFGMYQELDVILYFPKDFAILFREGNRDYLNYPFNFNTISFRAEILSAFYVGFNKKISEKLTLGIRYKLYSSMINISSTRNTGTLTTTRANNTPNVYEHTISDLDFEVSTSGLREVTEIEDDKQAFRNLLGRAYFGGNIGLGIDLGATYEFNEDFSATVSFLDLGGIYHTKHTEITSGRGEYTFNGVGFVFPDVANGDDVALPYYNSFEEEFEKAVPRDTSRGGYTQWRPAKINAGLHYNFGERAGSIDECDCLVRTHKNRKRSQIGAQYYAIFRPKGLQMAGTVYYSRNFDAGTSIKATYTVDSYSATNVGLGFAVNLGGGNFFVAADNLLYYSNIAKAKSVSLQLGFNILVDKQ